MAQAGIALVFVSGLDTVCALLQLRPIAQVSATLSGTVVDSSGAAVTSASVTATNVSTGAVLNATSNETGEYSFLSLAPGKYDLVAKKEGFQSSSLKGSSSSSTRRRDWISA